MTNWTLYPGVVQCPRRPTNHMNGINMILGVEEPVCCTCTADPVQYRSTQTPTTILYRLESNGLKFSMSDPLLCATVLCTVPKLPIALLYRMMEIPLVLVLHAHLIDAY